MSETIICILGSLFLITFIFKLSSEATSTTEFDIVDDEINKCKKCGGPKKRIDKKDYWLYMKCLKCGCESKIYVGRKR